MKYAQYICIGLSALIFTAHIGAQEYNSVPLDHEAYNIIAAGAARGIIIPPPSAKPWTVQMVKQKLWELIDDPAQSLSVREENIIISVINSFEYSMGFHDGRYRTAGDGFTFEAGFGWESRFSLNTDDASGDVPVAALNMAKLYAGGDIADFSSWKFSVQGGPLYINRDEFISAVFPYTFSRQWDGGVVSLTDGLALAGAVEGELTGSFFNRHVQLRLGRIRRDWGAGTNGTSLFMNSLSRPLTALEGTVSPFPWMHFSFLGGALEEPLFANALAAGQVELNLLRFLHFDMGASVVAPQGPNAAAFARLELILPNLFSLWGSVFVDNVHSSARDFFAMSSNSYAYQAGVKAVIHWLPFSSFTLHYTKVEPYCYSGEWVSGESLGYYLPPNSDELLARFDTTLLPALTAFVQYQLTRHGADYGYGAVGGSSLSDTLNNAAYTKYFLMDGVYRWDYIIKLGASYRLKAGIVPLSLRVETGLVITRFTINGSAGAGNEADYEALDDDVYRAGNGFIFSVALRLFSY